MFLKIKVKTGASEGKIIGAMNDGSLKISVKSTPENGKANEELRSFLSREFNVAKNNISIINGSKSNFKIISISDS